jgi:carboxyl-terminal processing protease
MKPSTAVVIMLPLVIMVTAFVLVGTRGAGAGSMADGVWWDEQVASFVRHRIASSYVDQVDDERASKIFYEGMDAYLHGLDEYCDFIPPDEYRRWKEETKGEYAGLGVKVQSVDDGLLLAGVLPGGPADKAGLHVGDTIMAADGKPLAGVDFDTIEMTRLLKGEPGSTVKLSVLRGPRPEKGPPAGAQEIVPVVRERVRPPTVFTRKVGPEGAFGVIRLKEFAEATQEDADRALETMLADDVAGVILDLRWNGGGVLPTAVALVDRFVRKGVIVRMEGRAPQATRIYEARPEGTLPDTVPLIVLVNGTSASASEVVAGALQDHRRALLVGERTYGKFLVQQITDIPGHDAAVQLTTSRYYLPSGRSYQRKPGGAPRPGVAHLPSGRIPPGQGIIPDVVVPVTDEESQRIEKAFANQESRPWGEEPPFDDVPDDWVDPQLARAVEVLQGELVLQKIQGAK